MCLLQRQHTRLSPETKYDFEVQGNLADGATTDWSYTETFITDPSTVILGDVNGDGSVNVADVNILISIVLGIDTLAEYPNGDLNGDGTGGIADLNLLISIVLENQ